VRAGCHRIEWREIEAFAKASGFFNETASDEAKESTHTEKGDAITAAYARQTENRFRNS
jgi:hypothetical protein